MATSSASADARPQTERRVVRAILLFVGVAVVSGALMVAGFLLALPLAFETQGGAGWRAAPLRSAVVLAGGYLLAPVVWLGGIRGAPHKWGFGSILSLSVLYGLLAVAVRWAWAMRRRETNFAPDKHRKMEK